MTYISPPKISIIVQNFNGLKYLKSALNSLHDLKYTNREVIVVDNDSNDGSLEFLETCDGISLVRNPVTGSRSVGLNKGLAAANGEFCLFLDCDIVVADNGLLEKLHQQFLIFSNPGIITLALVNDGESDSYFYGSTLSRLNLIRRNKHVLLDDLYRLNGMRCAGVQGAAFFVRKDFLEMIGGFDEMVPFGGEDVDIGIRSLNAGKSNYIYSLSRLWHIGMHERQDNQRYRSKFRYGNASLFLVIFKNYSALNVLLSAPLLFCYQLVKTIKDAMVRRDVQLLGAFIDSILFILRNCRRILIIRQITQSKRVVLDDVCFRINFDSINAWQV